MTDQHGNTHDCCDDSLEVEGLRQRVADLENQVRELEQSFYAARQDALDNWNEIVRMRSANRYND